MVTEDHSSQLSLCRREVREANTTQLESVFYISVVGDPARHFTMEVSPLPHSQFHLDVPKEIHLGARAKPHFFWATGILRCVTVTPSTSPPAPLSYVHVPYFLRTGALKCLLAST